jgi:hypothetical protein
MDEWDLDDEQIRPPKGSHGWVLWLIALVVVGAGGAIFWKMRSQLPEIVEQLTVPDAGVVAPEPEPLPIDEAEIDDAGRPTGTRTAVNGDELVRKLGARGAPDLQTWLSSPDVVQRIAAASRLIAQGKSPRPVISFIEIQGDFSVIEEKDQIFIAPQSYARYERIAKSLTSLDPTASGKAYLRVRPHFEIAYSQVARPGEHFDDVLVEALKRLANVQIPEGRVEVVEVGAIYGFKDPALESLTPAEKHMLRMGPEHGRAIQAWIRRFAAGAGLKLEI